MYAGVTAIAHTRTPPPHRTSIPPYSTTPAYRRAAEGVKDLTSADAKDIPFEFAQIKLSADSRNRIQQPESRQVDASGGRTLQVESNERMGAATLVHLVTASFVFLASS